MRQIVAAVPANLWDVSLDESRFTLREAMAHMADWEPILRGRIETALRNPGAQVEAYDESARAEEMKYCDTDPLEQLDKFAEQREITIKVLELAPNVDSPLIHPEKGKMTVADIANTMVGHDLYHIEHLTHYLGLSPR